jgi:uncharacterized membrane protein
MEKKNLAVSEINSSVNIERVTILVDGIFAITITLLVLELKPPEGRGDSLVSGLLVVLPRLFIYLIAFYTIANHWVVHQRMFRHIRCMDTTLLWVTIIQLLFITLIPFSTAILGRFPGEGLAAVVFSVNGFLHALTGWAFWAYVVGHHSQFAPESDPQLLVVSSRVWLFITLGWFTAALLGFINVNLAYASWILWPNLAAVWGSRMRQHLKEGA